MTPDIRAHYLQYARCWRLLKEHAGELNAPGVNLLLDVANLRQRDLEPGEEPASMTR